MRTRRGLSAVVGTVFAIIALSTTIAYVSYSMSILDKYNQTVLGTNQQSLDTSREKFQVTSVTIVNNKFNITVTNTGSLPINFTKLWVQNTTATDWTSSFAIGTKVVGPGGILYNIGQNIPLSALSTNAYHIKLVTSRGNTQEFNVNSVGSAPLNIQFYTFPSAVPSGFTTALVMVVTNNQSSTLTNLSPQISKWTSSPLPSTAVCRPSSTATPSSVSTLAPGNTAVFKWDLKIIGNSGQICTYVASLQNGFSGNTASATVAITPITATSSNWSTTWGILSINYTTLQWTQDSGTTWNNGWSVPCCINTVWRVDLSNNDPTRPFILNGNSTLVAFGSSPGSNSATQWYIVKNDYPPTHAYPINGQTIISNSTSKLYFGASSAGGTSGVSIGNSAKGQYAIAILSFGYWNSVQSNNFFGQNIPYEGIIIY